MSESAQPENEDQVTGLQALAMSCRPGYVLAAVHSARDASIHRFHDRMYHEPVPEFRGAHLIAGAAKRWGT